MGTHVIALMDERRDTLRGTLLLSLILHAVLFVVVVTYTMIGFHLGGAGPGMGHGGRNPHGGGVKSAGNSPALSDADHAQPGRNPEHRAL